MSEIVEKKSVQAHFDQIAKEYDKWKDKNAYYYSTMKAFVRRNIRANSSVLEVGCGTGDILASTDASRGVGIDISSEMIKLAQFKHPQHEFIAAAVEDFQMDEKFDYIILVDVADHVPDVLDVFESIYKFCHPETRIILTTVNPWWEPILSFMEKIGAKMPEGPHNFIEKRNISCILEIANFSVSYSGYLLLCPKFFPIVSFSLF